MSIASTNKTVLYPNAPWYFALGVIITWIGFSTSYFARITQTDIFHHIHGATAGLWMTLLIVQPILYKKGKLALHRKLGRIASFTLVPLLILGGIKMMHMMMLAKDSYPPGIPYQLAFIDACSMPMFLLFFSLGIYYGKNIQNHARYMACTVLVIIPPAITRLLFFIPWFNSFSKTVNGSFIITEIVLLLLLLDDKRIGKIRQPYVVAFILFGLLNVTLNYASNWIWWKTLLDKFTTLNF